MSIPSTLTAEQITPGDAGRLAGLFARNDVPAITRMFDPFPLSESEARRIAALRGKDGYYLAAVDGLTVGFSMLRGFDEGYEIPSFGVLVDRAHHGQGLGRSLTEWTLAEAWRRGVPAVRLTVYAVNRSALRLYASLRFVECERAPLSPGDERGPKITMLLERPPR